MLKHRVIPCLLLMDGGIVVTRKFQKPNYVGDPINIARIYNDKEVDELVVLDISATKNRSNPSYSIIERLAAECFMPLTYGGGISSVQQAREIFSLGVEKICIQSAALNNISIINDLSDTFGNQSIVISIDVKRNFLGNLKLYSSSRNRYNAMNWKEFLTMAVNAGAGEVILNAVHNDGRMCGFDTKLINEAFNAVNVPLVAVGGLGSIHDIQHAIESGASAVGGAAFFIYQGKHNAVLVTYPDYDELVKVTTPQ